MDVNIILDIQGLFSRYYTPEYSPDHEGKIKQEEDPAKKIVLFVGEISVFGTNALIFRDSNARTLVQSSKHVLDNFLSQIYI
jgi:hypothetical protein